MSLYGMLMSADVVDDLAVDLLGHPLVEAAVSASMWKTGIFRRLAAMAARQTVRVAQDQHGVGLNLAGARRRPWRSPCRWSRRRLRRPLRGNGPACGSPGRRRRSGSARSRSSGRYGQDVLHVPVQRGDDARKADDLRAGADNGGDFHA